MPTLFFPMLRPHSLKSSLILLLFIPNIPSVNKSCQLKLQYICGIIKLHHLHCPSLIQVPSFLSWIAEIASQLTSCFFLAPVFLTNTPTDILWRSLCVAKCLASPISSHYVNQSPLTYACAHTCTSKHPVRWSDHITLLHKLSKDLASHSQGKLTSF